MAILALGSRGPAVTALQERLRQLGYPVKVDGIFGAVTREAVRAFHVAQGLDADGKVGPKTQAALDAPDVEYDAAVAGVQRLGRPISLATDYSDLSGGEDKIAKPAPLSSTKPASVEGKPASVSPATGWRLARSLEVLRDQIDRLAPRRSKASDGTIGDQDHKERVSDHNPDADGVVKAMDITHDPVNGGDCHVLSAAAVGSGDPRIKYVIWNNRISNPTKHAGAWRKYQGANPHTAHMHVSVLAAKADDTSPWNLAAFLPPDLPADGPPLNDAHFHVPADYEPPTGQPEPSKGFCAAMFGIIRTFRRGA